MSNVSEKQKAIDDAQQNYKEYTSQQDNLLTSSYDKIDTSLVQVSGIILGLSISFISPLTGKFSLGWMSDLGWGLGLVIATIIFVLITHYLAKSSIWISFDEAEKIRDKDIAIITGYEFDHNKCQSEINACSARRKNINKVIDWLYILAAITFISGVSLLAMFTFHNAQMENSLCHKNQQMNRVR